MDSLTSIFKQKESLSVSALTPEQKKLFNGYDELGGDLLKYDEAVAWFESLVNKPMSLALCIVVLDKPSSWIFGGMKNSDVKVTAKAFEDLKMLIEQWKEAGPDDVKDFHLSKMEELVKKCPYLALSGRNVNIAIPEKAALGTKLVDSMPLYEDHELESLDDDQIGNMSKVRSFWKEEFRGVNVSRMKRIAMMYLELCDEGKMIKQGKDWIRNHGGKPSRATKHGNNNETIGINKKSIQDFMSEDSYWRKYRKVFNITFTAVNEDNARQEQSDMMTKFVERLSLESLVLPNKLGEDK